VEVNESTTVFESHRPALVRLAYRMLGDLGRAQDIVQDAWLRWQRLEAPVDSPKALLTKMVTRQCLNELGSARARREESRSNRLPEPVQEDAEGDAQGDPVERADQISMAFLVLLQRLTPPERAALLLHDVFDFGHEEVAKLLEKTVPACRQLLSRARRHVAAERRSFSTSREEHLRLLRAYLLATRTGNVDAIASLLTDDAVLITDGGPEGVTVGGVRNLQHPVSGARRVATAIAALSQRGAGLERREWTVNGQPALVAFLNGRPVFVVLLAVTNGRIGSIFIHADPARLSHLGSMQ
jgi:RNA polymerase sigma-70 factor (ECF subfamily)